MKITAGNPLERGKDISLTNARDYLLKLLTENFNGYVCATIKAKRGIEEGVILFHNGRIVASSYAYFKYLREYQAEPAMERFLNAMMAKTGVIDSFSLSSYQVQLVMTLNEEASLKNPIDSETLQLPNSYTTKYEDELAKKVVAETGKQTQIMKNLGLTGYLTGVTKEEIMKAAKEEDQRIERMIK